jgi:hypothetical protein
MHILSKSAFIQGNQCLKLLYLDKYHKNLASPHSLSQQFIFEQGQEVGVLARQLFPNGINISSQSTYNYDDSIVKTNVAIENSEQSIYEAAFLFDDVFAATDILVRENNSWIAAEVKSSTELKYVHILDAALQYYIIQKNGIKLHDIFIIYINNKYVRGSQLEVDKLFIKKSVLKEVMELQPIIPIQIEKFKSVLDKKEVPAIEIGQQCFHPYRCDFIEFCWRNISSPSVFDIASLKISKKFELFYQGVIELKNVPKEFPLNSTQRQQIDCEINQKEVIDHEKIREFVQTFKYPLYFLDFETFQLAIPKYQNTQPYQQIVFQYSLHKQDRIDSELVHFEFIADIVSVYPSLPLIERLIKDCQGDGDIVVYNLAFEKNRLEEFADTFPDLASPIKDIISRLRDLMIPFKERWYYTPAMNGSYSIKVVLPALVPELSYKNLKIRDGNSASVTYALINQGKFKGDSKLAQSFLLEYCKLDTFAMVKILDKLKSL